MLKLSNKKKSTKNELSFVKLEQEKEVLLDDITHDMKNHLMSIKGYVHIVNKLVAENEKAVYYMEKVNGKIMSISELVEHLYSLMRINQTKTSK